MRPARSKARRGGALVEFALLMIIFVPLMLYSIFLMDVPHMKLESQETSISTTWDYTARNSNPSGGDNNDAWAVTKINSFVWADHTSAFDNGADPTKPKYKDLETLRGEPHYLHHLGFGAQYAFNFQGGPDTQISCNLGNRDNQGTFNSDGTFGDDLAWASNPAFQGFASGSMGPGGLGHCFHTTYIYNYIVPQKFLQEFSRVDMTKMKHRTGDDSHAWQGDVSMVNNIPAFDESGVSYNTWALRNGATDGNIDNADISDSPLRQPPSTNPFMKAMSEANSAGPLTATWATVVAEGGVFTGRALSQKLVAVPAGTSVSGLPDSVGLFLEARFSKNNGGLETNGFESTPFDNVNRTYERAYRRRGPYYLGCKNPERYPCR